MVRVDLKRHAGTAADLIVLRRLPELRELLVHVLPLSLHHPEVSVAVAAESEIQIDASSDYTAEGMLRAAYRREAVSSAHPLPDR